MSINTTAVLIFGLPAIGIKDQELIDDGILSLISPWYDSERKYQIAGVLVEAVDEGAIEIGITEFYVKIAIASQKFKELTGLKGQLYLSTDIN